MNDNDLRGYTDAELSMLCFNIEAYYFAMMDKGLLGLRELLQDDGVLYTSDQWGMLCRDYFDGLEEMADLKAIAEEAAQ